MTDKEYEQAQAEAHNARDILLHAIGVMSDRAAELAEENARLKTRNAELLELLNRTTPNQ